jgi:hypothetical protein
MSIAKPSGQVPVNAVRGTGPGIQMDDLPNKSGTTSELPVDTSAVGNDKQRKGKER